MSTPPSDPGAKHRERAEREQRLVFGEVARQYDAYRLSYPDALFDAIVEFGGLAAGDRALEIGAGTGKATTGFLMRGLDVHALEPDAEMAAVAREKGIDVEESLFETWTPRRAFDLVYAAQAWHWVHGADRYDRAAAALRPGGTLALFWNKEREWTGELGAAIDAVYAELAPHLHGGKAWNLEGVLAEIEATRAFEAPVVRSVTWSRGYTRDEWIGLLGTSSDHRILPAEQRSRVFAAVGDVIDRHGGRVDAVYDAVAYLSRRV
jgi:SAM-dependent methyltransferase